MELNYKAEPAFPQPIQTRLKEAADLAVCAGLSKRELFAAMAMARIDVKSVQEAINWAETLIGALGEEGDK